VSNTGNQPGLSDIPIEYTIGQSFYFPGGNTTISPQSGLTSAVTVVNGETANSINIGAGPSSGATVTVTEGKAPGDVLIGVSVTASTAVAGVGATLPASGALGQLFYLTTGTTGLYIYLAGGWTHT
jgi:hypothetical protein